LGPHLKAVTGKSQGIDKLVNDVKNLTVKFEESNYNFFNKNNLNQWTKEHTNFKKKSKIIEEDTIKLINETFRDLRSAEGAFDLLQKFKTVSTLDKIS